MAPFIIIWTSWFKSLHLSCLLNSWVRLTTKKSRPHMTGLCEGIPPTEAAHKVPMMQKASSCYDSDFGLTTLMSLVSPSYKHAYTHQGWGQIRICIWFLSSSVFELYRNKSIFVSNGKLCICICIVGKEVCLTPTLTHPPINQHQPIISHLSNNGYNI